jgi:hypothetical protein
MVYAISSIVFISLKSRRVVQHIEESNGSENKTKQKTKKAKI